MTGLVSASVPRAVVAAPLYNGGVHVESAVRSLLGQTFEDFALVLVDDGSTDGTAEIGSTLANADPRARFMRNAIRVGMIENWRRCVQLTQDLYPGAAYFAWASDHDLWEPQWLEKLVSILDRDPSVVIAYPASDRIDANGKAIGGGSSFHTRGSGSASGRVWRMWRATSAGNAVYGLIRIDALGDTGIFRRVLAPDRLLLTELAFRGNLAQSPDLLWHRRITHRTSLKRQRLNLFTNTAPWYTYLPPALTHVAVLLFAYAIRGEGRPAIGRARGASLTAIFAGAAILHRVGHWILLVAAAVTPAALRDSVKRDDH